MHTNLWPLNDNLCTQIHISYAHMTCHVQGSTRQPRWRKAWAILNKAQMIKYKKYKLSWRGKNLHNYTGTKNINSGTEILLKRIFKVQAAGYHSTENYRWVGWVLPSRGSHNQPAQKTERMRTAKYNSTS